jgi:hypothetical protein
VTPLGSASRCRSCIAWLVSGEIDILSGNFKLRGAKSLILAFCSSDDVVFLVFLYQVSVLSGARVDIPD